VLLARLKEHITTVVGRYKGTIYAWDVVNEAISDKADELYRNSLFYQICGEEFIEKAFEYAHAADPGALLFYNDYNETNPVKRSKIIQMIRKLKAKGVPIHGVGLQAHWSIFEPSRSTLDETLKDFATLGIDMQITEFDISVYAKDAPASPYTEDLEAKQTEQYNNCFEAFRKYNKEISAVTFWNISDRSSWLDNFPVRGRKNYPLLFDKDLKPKKAFHAVTSF
jgi:endo-1,4-beta-xylanase